MYKRQVIDHKIAETVIKTNRRMTYTNVKKILADKDAAVMEEYKELVYTGAIFQTTIDSEAVSYTHLQ